MSDQELKEKICGVLGIYPEEIQHVLSVGIGENKINGIIEIFHSHMQTAFEYVIGDTDKIGADGLRASDGADMRYKVHEQRLRAAKWLGGDK